MRALAMAATLALALGTGPSKAEDTGPAAVVATIYRLLAASEKTAAPKSPFFEPAVRAKFFSAELRDLLRTADATTKSGETVFDFDPISNSQDPKIGAVTEETDLHGDRATVDAHFKNRGTPMVVTYVLVRENNAWKISDIEGTVEKNRWSVRDILQDAVGSGGGGK